MKVGTDGVLLGAWVNIDSVKRILDVGTGTGVIALMLAQRSNAVIHAIEVDKRAADQAETNVENSPWSDRVKVLQQSYQDFQYKAKQYDLIVSNPPFFTDSLLPDGESRSIARHNLTLKIEDLVKGAAEQLTSNGKLAIIYPFREFYQVVEYALKKSMYLIRRTDVFPTPDKPVKRVLAEFSFQHKPIEYNELIIEEQGRHRYSHGYKSLTTDFYLAH